MGTPNVPRGEAELFLSEVERALAEGNYPEGHPEINGRITIPRAWIVGEIRALSLAKK